MYYFIYPSKDTYIYELNTNDEKNFGNDENLVLKKDFDGSNGLNAVSRILLYFNIITLFCNYLLLNDISEPTENNSIFLFELLENCTSA